MFIAEGGDSFLRAVPAFFVPSHSTGNRLTLAPMRHEGIGFAAVRDRTNGHYQPHCLV